MRSSPVASGRELRPLGRWRSRNGTGRSVLPALVIAAGAIMHRAVSTTGHGFNVSTVGIILMIVGAVGLVASGIVFAMSRRPVGSGKRTYDLQATGAADTKGRLPTRALLERSRASSEDPQRRRRRSWARPVATAQRRDPERPEQAPGEPTRDGQILVHDQARWSIPISGLGLLCACRGLPPQTGTDVMLIAPRGTTSGHDLEMPR
jgi:hypothetical protein